MKRNIFSIAIILFAASFASAQLRLPQPSQKASVMQTVGVTDLTINYFRPAVKGRKIWGEWPVKVEGEATLDNQNTRPPGAPIVPYGHIWRTGANSATQFIITDDVMINGQTLAAGKYSLHTIPGKDEWTLVFNTDSELGGSFEHDPKKDALRVKTKPEWVADNQEMLAFMIEPMSDTTGTVVLRWEKIRVPFTVEVKDAVAKTLEKARASVAAAKPDDFSTPLRAANYARDKKVMADATTWYEMALTRLDEQIKTKENYGNLATRANILFNLGRQKEGFAAAQKAIDKGKTDKADTSALEKRVADEKAKR